MDDLPERVTAQLRDHPAIRGVELAGSRARGEAVELSDWDFAIDCTDFDEVAGGLPGLVRPLRPLAEQWDRLSPFPTYMLMLRGPVKVDFLFPHEPRAESPPWTVSSQTLAAIDDHFWDWALWLASKQQGGRTHLVNRELVKLFDHLLAPMGAGAAPVSVMSAVRDYSALRADLEARLGVTVRRDLDDEVRPALQRIGRGDLKRPGHRPVGSDDP